MSHRNRGRNLSEWADLVGASLPDSVEDFEDASARSEGYSDSRRPDSSGAEFRETDRRDFGTDLDHDG